MRGDVPAIGGYHELAAGPVTLHLGSALLGWDAAVSTSSSFPCREGVFADAALSHPRTTEKSGLGSAPTTAETAFLGARYACCDNAAWVSTARMPPACRLRTESS